MTQGPSHRSTIRSRKRRLVSSAFGFAVVVAVVATSTGAFEGPVAPSSGLRDPGPSAVRPVRDTVPEVQVSVDVRAAVSLARERATEPLPDLSDLTLPELQEYAAQMQTEFVQASLAYEEAQTQADQAEVSADRTERKAAEALERESEVEKQFVAYVQRTFAQDSLTDPTLLMLASGPESTGDLLGQITTARIAADVQGAAMDRLQEAREEAELLADEAAASRAEAVAAEGDAEVLLEDIQGRASKVATAANEALSTSTDGQTMFASAEQQARNDAALKSWRGYLRSLARAQVVPPAAADLRASDDLPSGLRPLRGANGTPVDGVASVEFKSQTITVLPAETIASVSRAFAQVGKPYVSGSSGSDTYDCAGFTSAAYAPESLSMPAGSAFKQFQRSHIVSTANAQVGDLVFFDMEDDGIQHVGINLGGDLMLAADAAAQQVGVQPFPSVPSAVARVTLPHRGKNAGGSATKSALTECGGSAVSVTGSGMVYPMKDGTYTFTAEFGQAGSRWASGYHTGLDFAAPVGTPVMAAKGGVVTVSESSWGGPNFVTIDHADGLETVYAHMSQALVKSGDVVSPGDLIGAVGELGNVTGPHLHFEVLVGGVKVDPMVFLAGSGSNEAGWGGFTNGLIPASALCPLSATATHMLRCDAAAAFDAMATAYLADIGSELCLTDSYRSYASQVALYAKKPTLAAIPGTSNHGWGLAVDLCGGIESWGTPQRDWMTANAARFGWASPQWAQQGQGREEPWHWEFGALS